MIEKKERQIRFLLGFFIVSLVISGLTAFPLQWELELLNKWVTGNLAPENLLQVWISNVYMALLETYTKFPFIAYGTDWLAFSHLVIAVFFIGPWLHPGKDLWIIKSGIVACLMVFPLAFIAGEIRHIPVMWRIIDCSFGIIGIIPLGIVLKLSKSLKNLREDSLHHELYKQKGALARR